MCANAAQKQDAKAGKQEPSQRGEKKERRKRSRQRGNGRREKFRRLTMEGRCWVRNEGRKEEQERGKVEGRRHKKLEEREL